MDIIKFILIKNVLIRLKTCCAKYFNKFSMSGLNIFQVIIIINPVYTRFAQQNIYLLNTNTIPSYSIYYTNRLRHRIL